MGTDLIVRPAPFPDALPVALAPLAEAADAFAAAARAPNTLRGYRSDWRDFTAWCGRYGLGPLPTTPEAVCLYLADSARRLKAGSIARRLNTIAVAHRTAGHESPTRSAAVRDVWAGIRRTLGVAQQGKAALRVEDLRRMVASLPAGLRGTRDRAVLLLGFAGAFRRSELVALDAADLTETPAGLVVGIRRSKTDQAGQGALIGIPRGSHPDTCPVRAVAAWRAAAGFAEGPLFRPVDRCGRVGPSRLSDRSVALIIKRAARTAGVDADGLSGHSLRAGLATAAAEAGVPELAIMDQTRHKSLTMLKRYVRRANLFASNAAAKVGL